jgi:hypothetical protein
MELQFRPCPARKLSTNLYDIYYCWVYSEWTDDGQRNCPKHVVSCQNKFVRSVHLVGLIIRKFVRMHGHMNVKFACKTWTKKLVEVFKQMQLRVTSCSRFHWACFRFPNAVIRYKSSVGVGNTRQSSDCVLLSRWAKVQGVWNTATFSQIKLSSSSSFFFFYK